MNKIIFFISLFTLSNLFSCTEDEDFIASAPVRPTSISYLKVISSGATWSAETVVADKIEDGENFTIQISSRDEDGNSLTISLPQKINQLGTYAFSFSSASGVSPQASFVNVDSNVTYRSSSGKLIISQFDSAKKIIRGNFEFTGINFGSGSVLEKEFEGGEFQVNF